MIYQKWIRIFPWILDCMIRLLQRQSCTTVVYNKDLKKLHVRQYSPSDFGAGGLRVAQFVRILLLPSHCPFMAPMALSAS